MKDMFSNIVGNTALRLRFGNDILASRFPHAVIIEGAHGTGKHTIARNTAAALVCENKDDGSLPLPCGKCISCRKVIESKSPDVITIGCEDKATIGVDAIRFLKEDIYIIPNDTDHKIYIIEDADKMTPQAQNALLLTLEEPPSYVHFFLLCENADSLLETIRSRAPIFRTEPLTKDEIDSYICANDRRAAQMKLSSPDEYAELLSAAGFGIGNALEFLDTKAYAPIKQLRSLTYDFINLAIRSKGAKEALPLLMRLSGKRDILSDQLAMISEAIRDLILLKKNDDATLLFFSDRDAAIELSDRASLMFLYKLYQAVQCSRDEISRNANTRLCLIKLAIKADILK